MSGFANAVVGGGGALVRDVVMSDDYVAGVSGWAIFKDGTAEFNDGTFRGEVIVGSIAAGAAVQISDTVPPSLVSSIIPQVFTSIIEPCILMFVSPTVYYFQIAGVGAAALGGGFRVLRGWASLSSSGFVEDSTNSSSGDSAIFSAGALNLAAGQLVNVTSGHMAYGFGPVDSAAIPGGVIDAVQVGHVGTITAAISAETNIPDLELFLNVVNGVNYWIEAGVCLSATVATDTWELRARTGTAVTGTGIGEGDGSSGTFSTAYIRFMYTATSTGAVNVFFSILRRTGTGTFQANGSPGSGFQRTYAKCVSEENQQSGWRIVL